MRQSPNYHISMLLFTLILFTFALNTSSALRIPVSTSSIPFLLPESDSDSMNFIVVGDWGGEVNDPVQVRQQRRVADAMGKIAEKFPLSFVLSTGDNFYPDGLASEQQFKSQFTDMFNAASLQNTPFLISLGNHDYHQSVMPQFEVKSDPRWHLIDRYYNIRIPIDSSGNKKMSLFVLDSTLAIRSYHASQSSAQYKAELRQTLEFINAHTQLNWFQEQLAASTDEWKLVVQHHPLVGSKRVRKYSELSRDIMPLLMQYNVAALFTGHEHRLQHDRIIASKADKTLTIDQLISGAGCKTRSGEPKPNKQQKRLMNKNPFNFSQHLVDKNLQTQTDHRQSDVAVAASTERLFGGNEVTSASNIGSELWSKLFPHSEAEAESQIAPSEQNDANKPSSYEHAQLQSTFSAAQQTQLTNNIKTANPIRQRFIARSLQPLQQSADTRQQLQQEQDQWQFTSQTVFQNLPYTMPLERQGGFMLCQVFAVQAKMFCHFMDGTGKIMHTATTLLPQTSAKVNERGFEAEVESQSNLHSQEAATAATTSPTATTTATQQLGMNAASGTILEDETMKSNVSTDVQQSTLPPTKASNNEQQQQHDESSNSMLLHGFSDLNRVMFVLMGLVVCQALALLALMCCGRSKITRYHT